MIRPHISLIIPCFNEAPNLAPLLEEITGVMSRLEHPWEVVVIDDASTDGSAAVLQGLTGGTSQLRLLRHEHRTGGAAGLITGMTAVRGEIIITMDADLQHDPHEIPAMLSLLESAGVDAVCPQRSRRACPPLKRATSVAGNILRAAILRDGIHDSGYTFRIIRRHALLEMPRFSGLHRFLPGLLRLHGFEIVQPMISQRHRRYGKSKYGFWNRLLPGLFDLIGVLWYRHRYCRPKLVT